jgi:hypothetical protein
VVSLHIRPVKPFLREVLLADSQAWLMDLDVVNAKPAIPKEATSRVIQFEAEAEVKWST